MKSFEYRFVSDVWTPAEGVWKWITSLKGMAAEVRPFLRVSIPKNEECIGEQGAAPGQCLFNSKTFLFGFIPFGYSELTMIECNEGEGFVEQSPMGSMKLWRHERRITTTPEGSRISDHLTFQPRFGGRLVAWFIRLLFRHRHKVIANKLEGIGRQYF